MVSRFSLKLFLVHVIAIAGLIVSFLLTKNFYEVRSGASGFKSFCNINNSMNCDVVAASPYAEFAFGIPLSSFGAGWFVALLLISFIVYLPNWRKEALRFAFGLSLVGTLTGVFYIFIMATKLKTYCLLCLGVDALNLSALLVLISLKPEKPSIATINRFQWVALLVLILISVTGPAYALTKFDQIKLSDSQISELASSLINNPPLPVSMGAEHPSVGPLSAPVTIVEFSDFQCPHCRIGASLVNTLFHRYPGQLRIEFRNFPIDPICNSAVNHAGHPGSCEAAKTALCAYKLGKFEEVYQEFFEKQGLLRPGGPKQLAIKLGLDEKKLEACLKSPEIDQAILKDIQEAMNLEINATPAFFVNGHKMEGIHPISSWNKIIEHFIQSK
jgi:protein-disulfide isomerase/uncharacterized membrane protein